MSETDILRGEITILGPIHGGLAINTIVTYYEDPQNWSFKQFVSDAQIRDFARQEMLVIKKQE